MANDTVFVPDKKTAVVLFQLGGPDSTEAVEPFLYNLFMDPDIIDFPLAFLARKPLAKFISSKRAPRVRENYSLIGGKSPILDLTNRQAQALEQALRGKGLDAKVFIAMRYWHPFTETVVQEIQASGFEQIILLPLYPQFSQATTFSSLNEWKRSALKHHLALPTKFICCYPNHPKLIEAFIDNISRALVKFSQVHHEEIEIVFSAHGVPVSYIEKGDPYQLHVEETVRKIVEAGKFSLPNTLCYQSKVGPMQWLKPSLVETVHRLADSGRKYLLIVPVAFVTDHIETLHEINIDVRREALALGINQFELMPALNDHPKFIECLTDLAMALLSSTGQRELCMQLHSRNTEFPAPGRCPWTM